jgi:hypothetical protein
MHGLRSIVAATTLVFLLAGSVMPATAQLPPVTGSQSGPLTLELRSPYEGAACGTAFQTDWKLDLDRVVGFAETQLSACDLALTLATIEGTVARAGAAIAKAHTENWNAWMAAAAFLPGIEDAAAGDPGVEGRRVRVRDAQDRIQSARNGLRFLAKLAALMQFPPAPDPHAITAAPIEAPVADETAPLPGSPIDVGRGQVACVTGTAWVIEARPAQNLPQRAIDDPVAGEALAWLSTLDAGHLGVHAIAACPGVSASSVGAAPTLLPGSAQGLLPAVPQAAPPPAPADPSAEIRRSFP